MSACIETGSAFPLIKRGCRLAHTARHLQLDQPIQLNRVLHGEFLRDRLDEAVDDQRIGLGLIQASAHQVEELVVTDLRDGRLVADLGLVLFDANGGIGIGARMLIEQERVTADTGLGVVRTPVDADQTAIRGSTSPVLATFDIRSPNWTFWISFYVFPPCG